MRRITSNDVWVQDFHQQIGDDLTTETKQHRFLREVFEAVYLPHESFQTFKERIQEQRKYLQSINLRFCSYSRAHHYHFFLQDFPRIPGQPTYALDMNNSFRSTYSQQEKLYKGERLGNILNRVAFTLPKTQQFFDFFMSRKKGNTHNKAHDQLFSIEGSKWSLDRQLLTCKMILKNLQKLTSSYSLWQFHLVRQRFQLQFLLDGTDDIEEKKVKLQAYIDQLQQKKKSMSAVWQVNDEMFFHSSLQQKLHDNIQDEQNQQFMQSSKRIQYYITRNKNLVEQLGKEEANLDLVLTKIFTYAQSRVAAISEGQIDFLKGHLSKINKPQKTTLPLLIFNYGSTQLREKVNRIVCAFIENNQIDQDQQCTNTLKRLFRGMFLPNQLIHDIGAYETKLMTKTMRDKLKKQMDQNKDRVVQTIFLDEYINQTVIDESTSYRKQCLPIVNLSQYKIPICEQEIQMLFYYNNLCKTVSLFEPLIHDDEIVMKVLCSPYLDHLLHGIIGKYPIKSIGQLIYNMRHLVEHGMMSNCIKQEEVYSDFQWEFKEDTGVGIVWNGPRKPSHGKNLSHFYSIMIQKIKEKEQQNEQSSKEKERKWQEGVDQDEKQQLGNIPVKKVKQNQNQHL